LDFEELGDEGGREVQREALAAFRRLFGEIKRTVGAVGQEVALDVEKLGAVY